MTESFGAAGSLLDRSTDERAVLKGFTNGWNQMGGNALLDDVPQGGQALCFTDKCRLVVNREKDDTGFGPVRFDPANGVKAVEQGHGNIRNNEVGNEGLGDFDQGMPVLDKGYHLKFRFEQCCDAFEQIRIVIGQQDSRFSHLIVVWKRGGGITSLYFLPFQNAPTISEEVSLHSLKKLLGNFLVFARKNTRDEN